MPTYAMSGHHTCRSPGPACPVRLAVALGCLAPVVALVGGTAPGQTPPKGPGMATPRLSREELMSRFDVNRDGKVDQTEFELASSKMRLERAEMRLSRTYDPVTGLPRDEEADGDDPDLDERMSIDELARRLGLEPSRPGAAPAAAPALPERQAPLQPRIFGLTPPSRTQAAGSESAASPAVPGGVRAGGRPALPGYGSGVQPPSFNAGRADRLAPTQGADRQAVAGGLVPRLQPPPRPAPPRRRTVEDFNVY